MKAVTVAMIILFSMAAVARFALPKRQITYHHLMKKGESKVSVVLIKTSQVFEIKAIENQCINLVEDQGFEYKVISCTETLSN